MSFSSYIKSYKRKLTKDIENNIEMLLKTAWNDIKRRTPVISGTLRDNWQMSNSISSNIGYTSPNFSLFAKSIMRGQDIYIFNNLSYAYYIEYGQRKGGSHKIRNRGVAAQGMIQITRRDLERQML